MVIYFLLFFFFCCIYGNFLINMEWSFIFKSKVVEMYCTVFFIIVARFSFLSRPEVSFSRENRVFVLFFSCEEEFWSSTEFSMDYFAVFADRASHRGSVSLLLFALLPPPLEWPGQAAQPGSHSSRIEAQYFFGEHPQQHKAVVTERHKQTSFLTVKLLWALWLQLSAWYLFCVRPAHVLMPFFFSIGLFYFEH